MSIFRSNPDRHDGVPAFNFYLLRVMFALMATFLAFDVWKNILGHVGPWNPIEAAAWCFWAGFSLLAIFGVFKPTKLLPVVLLEIVYKVLWLGIVAVPVWFFGVPAGEGFQTVAFSFVLVVLPIVAMPWKHFISTLGLRRSRPIVGTAKA
ncbi:MAG: hypothetical protein AB7K08_01450 [Microbacteriaceae bacterium]